MALTLPADAAWPALFHAVSAFCNAGFSTFSTSLVAYADRPTIPLTISVLITKPAAVAPR